MKLLSMGLLVAFLLTSCVANKATTKKPDSQKWNWKTGLIKKN